MSNRPQNLRRLFVEPKIYPLILESRRGSILHLGVHYSLDEAVAAATPSLLNLTPHKPGDSVGVQLWTTLRGEKAINALIDPSSAQASFQGKAAPKKPKKEKESTPRELSPEDQIKQLEKSKNDLMQTLIAKGDPSVVESSKSILSKTERKFIMEKINGGAQSNNTK